MAQRGTVEDVLEILMFEKIDVLVLKQSESKGLLRRTVLLKGHSTGTHYILANSIIDLSAIPSNLGESLRDGKRGLGRLIAEMKLETFIDIRKRVSDPKTGQTYRRYTVNYNGKVAIRISEKILV
jgi:chorismate-pyruvate lyase